MFGLRIALRETRQPKGKDPSDEKFLVRVKYLDGHEGDFPISKADTFAVLASAVGPANLVFLRYVDGKYEYLYESESVYSFLLRWKREEDQWPTIVAPFYFSQTPAPQDVLNARAIDPNKCAVVSVKRPDNDERLVKITFRTTARELARHLSVTRCIGLFSATLTADATRFADYELLDQNCNIMMLLSAWASTGIENKVIVYPLVRFCGFVDDDDGEPCNADEDEYVSGSDYDEDEDEDSAALCYGCGRPGAYGAHTGGAKDAHAAVPRSGDSSGLVNASAALTLDEEISDVPHPLSAHENSTLVEDPGGSDSGDCADAPPLPTFEELIAREEAAGEEVLLPPPPDPVYELNVNPWQILNFAAEVVPEQVIRGLEQYYKQYGNINRRATVDQTVRALIQEVIRLAGKEPQLRLQDITEESMYAALLCETAADRDLLQLDVPLLACIAVCSVTDADSARYFHTVAARYRKALPGTRLRLQLDGDENAPTTEARALVEILEPVRMVVSVSEDPSLDAPAPSAREPLVSSLTAKFEGGSPVSPAHAALPTSAILLADKVAAVTEVPFDISHALVCKGLLVEGLDSGRVVVTVIDNNYSRRRWVTRPATSLTYLLHFLALAVLCEAKQLRDLLLTADRANGGEISAHFDECQVEHKKMLEELRLRRERREIEYLREEEEERRHPPVPDGKIEIP
jgi:hypothetical protein